MKDKLLIYELDCLNSVFSIDRKILKKIFSNIIIPRIAYDELSNKMDEDVFLTIKSLKRSKFVILEDFDVSTPQYKLYRKLKDGIDCKCRGKCESAAIIIAKENNLTILSNQDRDYYKEYKLNRISMIDMLTKAYLNKLINVKEAEIFWSRMTFYNDSDISLSQFFVNIET